MGGSDKKPKWDAYYKEKPFDAGVRSCDIGLVRGRSHNPLEMFFRDKICDLSNGILSHAFIVGRQGDVIEALSEGVRVKKMDKYINKQDGVLIFRNLSLTEAQKENILSFAYIKAEKNTPYDWWGFFHHLLPFIPQNKDQFYCSELVSMAYKKENIITTNKTTGDTTPQDILDYQFNYGSFKDEKWQLADYQNFNLDEIVKFLNTKWSV